jgi:hypothetical protein
MPQSAIPNSVRSFLVDFGFRAADIRIGQPAAVTVHVRARFLFVIIGGAVMKIARGPECDGS